MAKKVTAEIRLQIPAGAANPAPPVGPALGQAGVNIMEFCKQFNAATQSQAGMIIPACDCVAALNCLQNSMMLTPAWPRAGPTGGAGLAAPAGICRRISAVTFFAICSSILRKMVRPAGNLPPLRCHNYICTSLGGGNPPSACLDSKIHSTTFSTCQNSS